MRQLAVVCSAAVMVAASTLPSAAQTNVNVLQDCWTHKAGVPNVETENYCYTLQDPVQFIWKHKILQKCSKYRAEVYIQNCVTGKPPLLNPLLVCKVATGPINPNPNVPERLVKCTAPPGSIPPGTWDWFVMTECDDTNGVIGLGPDHDVDDECGLNAGLVLGGPLVFGPEPVELWDPDPGGVPACRLTGEEGTTRPWCFQVTQVGTLDLR